MQSGKLTRTIIVQRASADIDAYGTPVKEWDNIATLRAEVIDRSTTEFLQGGGASDEAVIVFRVRYIASLTNADRIVFQTSAYEIKEITELGRRKGLELRCVEETSQDYPEGN